MSIAVAADMADRDARGLGVFVRDLDHFLAALLVEFRDAQADDLPFGRGVRPRLAALIAFSTACTIERSHTCTREQPRLRHADGRDLIERHVAAIGLDLDVIEQARGGAPGAQAAELVS